MQKWRYHSLLMRDLSIADAKLNSEGDRGWELVSMCLIDSNTARAYFKQPLNEQVLAVAAVAATVATGEMQSDRSAELPSAMSMETSLQTTSPF